MPAPVYVTGVGMTRFHKPQDALELDYTEMVKEAGSAALADAGIELGEVDAGYASYVFGESCSGHRAIYEIGTTGMPIYNVNSNCSSGSSALSLARQAIASGDADVVLCVGFEKMTGDVIHPPPADRSMPVAPHIIAGTAKDPLLPGAYAHQIFGNAGREHMERYGSTAEHFAMVGEKNHRHSAANPNAQFRDVSTLDEILAAPMIHHPLTRLQCSAPSTGAAAVVVMSEAAVRQRGLAPRAVEILGQGVATDAEDSFEPPSAIMAVGFGMTQRAARKAYEQSGVGIEDVDLIELHDCFSTNEILTYESLGLAPEGKGHLLVEDGGTSYGGTCVVNPSGGLIGKGHPLGATGLAQCAEITWQLRGEADQRQVEGARTALQHNLGLGGTAVVTIYRGFDGGR